MKITAVIACAALALSAAAVPPLSVVELGNDAEHIDACGIWETTASGAVLRFSRIPGTRDDYNVTIIESDDYRLEPGTVVGTLKATATPRTYDAEFAADPAQGTNRLRNKKLHFIVEFDTRLRSCAFKAYRRGKRVSFRRLLPYLFRIAVTDGTQRPEGIDGAVRIDANPTPVIL